MTSERLTQEADWDRYWSDVELPAEVRRESAGPYLSRILDVFDRYLPGDPERSALEIGGAPGQYLAYVHRRFGYACGCLDYSRIGCEKARENFELLGIPLTVHQADLFDDALNIGSFDIVFSLGLVEHFEDLLETVARHVDLVTPGGMLLIGCPNFQGLARAFMKRLSPELLASHNLESMNLRRWDRFERELRLERIFRGYVGGFEPGLLRGREPPQAARLRAWDAAVSVLDVTLGRRLSPTRRIDTRWTSGYATGVYRRPA
jgi:SAM-dependent methyltransferase